MKEGRKLITKKSEGVFVIIAAVVVIICLVFIFGFGKKKTSEPDVVAKTVTFIDSFDDAILKRIEVLQGKSVVAPDIPEHAGKTFKGWYLETNHDSEIKNFNNIMDDITVVALYQEDNQHETEQPKEESEDKIVTKNNYIVSYVDSITGKVYKTEKVKRNKDAKNNKAPVHAGYIFKEFEGNTKKISKDETVIAKYEKSDETYKVKYVALINGAKQTSNKDHTYLINESYKVSKSNYTLKNAEFIGWTKDKKKASVILKDKKELKNIKIVKPNTMVYAKSDVTYYAVFARFPSNESENNVDKDNVNQGSQDNVNDNVGNNNSKPDNTEQNIDAKFTVNIKYIVEVVDGVKKEVVVTHKVLGNNILTPNPEKDLQTAGIDLSYYTYQIEPLHIVKDMSIVINLSYRGLPSIIGVEKTPFAELKITASDILNNPVASYSFDGGQTWQTKNTHLLTGEEEVLIQVKDKNGFISSIKNVDVIDFKEIKEETYNLMIDFKNGTRINKSIIANSSIKLDIPNRPGYVFTGWETSGGKIENNILTLTNKANVKIYATWQRRSEIGSKAEVDKNEILLQETVKETANENVVTREGDNVSNIKVNNSKKTSKKRVAKKASTNVSSEIEDIKIKRESIESIKEDKDYSKRTIETDKEVKEFSTMASDTRLNSENNLSLLSINESFIFKTELNNPKIIIDANNQTNHLILDKS